MTKRRCYSEPSNYSIDKLSAIDSRFALLKSRLHHPTVQPVGRSVSQSVSQLGGRFPIDVCAGLKIYVVSLCIYNCNLVGLCVSVYLNVLYLSVLCCNVVVCMYCIYYLHG